MVNGEEERSLFAIRHSLFAIRLLHFLTIEQAGSGGPNASSPEIFARIV
jgi:hypothetical protein